MGQSLQPSVVVMPPERSDLATVLDFLIDRFQRIDAAVWRQRVIDGKVSLDNGQQVDLHTPYKKYQKVRYFREVENERIIPFQEQVIYQDEEILVACKPHFLPVTPKGSYVQECLLNRLIQSTGCHSLAPMHRIDRETAGLVLFSRNPATRAEYHALFRHPGTVTKRYQAWGRLTGERPEPGQQWTVRNRLGKAEQWFRTAAVEGEVNAHSEIQCLRVEGESALFDLSPLTGKTHQLRVHMSDLGFPLVHDRFYPQLSGGRDDNFETPLQLLAKGLSFQDPVTGKKHDFQSARELRGL